LDTELWRRIDKRKKEIESTEDSWWPRLKDEFGFDSTESIRKQYSRKRSELVRLGLVSYESKNVPKPFSEHVVKAPKIFVTDIETSTILTEVFDSGKQYVGKQNILESWYMICWAGMWLDSGEVFGDTVTSKEAQNRDDSRISESLYKYVDEADILITYNGKGFDVPRMYRRFKENGLNKPSYFNHIDLYPTIRNQFDYESNAMDFVASRLELVRKIQNSGWTFWQAASRGDEQTLEEMFTYCKGDIPPLQELYYEFRTWIPNHPAIFMYDLDTDEPQCRYCGSTEITTISDRLIPVGLNLYKQYRCNECHGTGRYKEGQLSKDKKKTLTRNLSY